MIMPPRLRRIALTTHIACSVGWLGAVAGFLVLNIAGLTSHNAEVVRGAYLSMNLIGFYIIVPLSVAALTTGLIQSLGTEWGLFRHYWVLTKLTLTIGATGLLMVHQFGAVEKAARRVLAVAPGTLPEMHGLGTELVSKAGLAVVALIAITALSIFKPWGLTRYGLRKRSQRLSGRSFDAASTLPSSDSEATASLPLGNNTITIAVAIAKTFSRRASPSNQRRFYVPRSLTHANTPRELQLESSTISVRMNRPRAPLSALGPDSELAT